MTQIAQPHRRTKLVHLRIRPYAIDAFRIANAEILQTRQLFPKLPVVETRRAPLDGVEHLRRMETKARNITEQRRAFSAIAYAERMCGIVDHLQPVPARDALDFLHAADISVDMNRHDRGRAVCN